ncbi:MAG: class B sortase [Lachnospiraceae bacterium]|nr:class B sortase [Lachnospiraceae bacterium]
MIGRNSFEKWNFTALQEINPEIVAWLYCPDTVIYGHHMASGRMFASLVRYAKQAYYEEHPIMYLSVEGQTYLLELFAGYTTTEDQIVTLSTRAYSFENVRYVVHGRLVELDEASE